MEDNFIYLTDSKGRLTINMANIIMYRDSDHTNMQAGYPTKVLTDSQVLFVKETEREITNIIRTR